MDPEERCYGADMEKFQCATLFSTLALGKYPVRIGVSVTKLSSLKGTYTILLVEY